MTDYHLKVSNNTCVFGTFNSPIYTFSLMGNKIVCTPSQGTNREIPLAINYIKG